MRDSAIGFVGLVLALGAVSSCASTGPISGQLVVPGQAPQPVALTYATDRFEDAGRITTTLPGGEMFEGRFVQVTSTTPAESIGPMLSSWSGPMWIDSGPFAETRIGGSVDATTFRTNYSGQVVASLLGNRGTVMRCRFRLVNPPGGMPDGGAGECQLSTGGTIDARF